MVSCTCAVEACSASPIAGSDGKYISIDSGPSPVKSDSNKVSAKVPGRSIGTHGCYTGMHRSTHVNRHCEPTGPARSGRPDDKLREAIQGRVHRLLDCFVASLLAMTTVASEQTSRENYERSGLGAEELAPALRADIAVDDFAGVWRLKLDAAVALLIIIRMVHILGVGLTDLLRRRGAPDCNAACRCADGYGRPGNDDAP